MTPLFINSSSFGTLFFQFSKRQNFVLCILTMPFLVLAISARENPHLDLLSGFGLLLLTAIAWLVGIWYAKKTQLSPRRVIFVSGLLVAISFAGHPLWEDDYYRYLWDGFVFSKSGSPYGIAPEDFFSHEDLPNGFDDILSGINHPEIPTIYGPTSQWLFYLAYTISPGALWPMHLLVGLAYLGCIALCLRMMPPWKTLWFAMNPLVFKEALLTLHPDIFGAALLILAFFSQQRERHMLSAIAIALALGVKIFAILLLPFFVLSPWRKFIPTFGLTLAILYLPFVLQGATEHDAVSHMATHFEFNSAFWGLTRLFFDPLPTQLLVATIFIIAFVWYFFYVWWRQNNNSFVPHGDWIIGFFLFLSPVINPWYFIWWLPFAALRPSITATAACLIIFLSYIVPINMPELDLYGNYDQPIAVRVFTFGILLAVLLGELWKKVKEST